MALYDETVSSLGSSRDACAVLVHSSDRLTARPFWRPMALAVDRHFPAGICDAFFSYESADAEAQRAIFGLNVSLLRRGKHTRDERVVAATGGRCPGRQSDSQQMERGGGRSASVTRRHLLTRIRTRSCSRRSSSSMTRRLPRNARRRWSQRSCILGRRPAQLGGPKT